MTDIFNQLVPHPQDDAPTPEFTENLRTRITAIEQGEDATPEWHLAQLNLGVFAAPLDAPEMEPFVAGLDRINTLAEQSPGFVWRLTDDTGAPSSYVEVPGTDDPLMASNLTVWEDLESLWGFMYRTDHVSYLRRRAEWFQHVDVPMTVGWWIPAGTLPTLANAVERLEHLREHGATDIGFPLGKTIPDPPTLEV